MLEDEQWLSKVAKESIVNYLLLSSTLYDECLYTGTKAGKQSGLS